MTLDHRNLIIVAAAVLGFGVVNCEKSNRSEQTQTTGATQPSDQTQAKEQQKKEEKQGVPTMTAPDPNESTIDRVTIGRCDREMACGRIGQGKKWNDMADCKRDLGKDTRDDLKANECKGVLNDKVQTCLDALRSENCDNVQSGLSRVEACQKQKLCKD